MYVYIYIHVYIYEYMWKENTLILADYGQLDLYIFVHIFDSVDVVRIRFSPFYGIFF
jgi:hypothetical protein